MSTLGTRARVRVRVEARRAGRAAAAGAQRRAELQSSKGPRPACPKSACPKMAPQEPPLELSKMIVKPHIFSLCILSKQAQCSWPNFEPLNRWLAAGTWMSFEELPECAVVAVFHGQFGRLLW